MTTQSGTYQQQLLIALRLHNIPGPRIAEALAEVDSHVTETGEDPYRAFGPPKDYARRLSAVLGGNRDGGWLSLLRTVTWRDAVVAVASVAGTGLLSQGLFGIGGRHDGLLGLPAVGSAVAGLVVLGGLAGWLGLHLRGRADRVVDPRTGADMARPAPRWALAVAVLAMPCFLLVGYLVSRGI